MMVTELVAACCSASYR